MAGVRHVMAIDVITVVDRESVIIEIHTVAGIDNGVVTDIVVGRGLVEETIDVEMIELIDNDRVCQGNWSITERYSTNRIM